MIIFNKNTKPMNKYTLIKVRVTKDKVIKGFNKGDEIELAEHVVKQYLLHDIVEEIKKPGRKKNKVVEPDKE